MKGYQFQYEDVDMTEALRRVQQLQGVDFKQRNTLLLLTEEMFAMMSSVLDCKNATFKISCEAENRFSLGLDMNVDVTPQMRMEYLSMSKSGQNIAYRGLKGKIRALLDAMAEGATMLGTTPDNIGILQGNGPYIYSWNMSQYSENLSDDEKAAEWDGMEKSIIANFSDDVQIGVLDNRIEMVVIKNF